MSTIGQELRQASPESGTPRWAWALLLIFIYVSWRITCLVLIHPFYFNTSPIEEMYRGAIGMEILRGPAIPLWEYRADNYSGGSLITGGLAAFFFKFAGNSFFTLKLAALSFGTAALWFWTLILLRFCGKKSAFLFCLFYTFAPPYFVIDSLTSMGYHSQTDFFSAFFLFLYFKKQDALPLQSRLYALAAGLVAGLGLWFCYTFALTLAAWGLLVVGIRGFRILNLRLFYGVTGLILGLIPWFMIHGLSPFSNHDIHGAGMLTHFQPWDPAVWNGFPAPFLRRMAQAFSMDPHPFVPVLIQKTLYSVLLGLPVLLAFRFVFSLHTSPHRIPRMIVLFFGLYALLLCFADHTFDLRHSRYLLPFFTFLFAATASALPYVHAQGLSLATASIFVLGGLMLTLPLMSFSFLGELLSIRGISYAFLQDIPYCEDVSQCRELASTLRRKLSPAEQFALDHAMIQDDAERSRLELPHTLWVHGPAWGRLFRIRFFYHLGLRYFRESGEDLSIAVQKLQHLRTLSRRSYYLGLFAAADSAAELDNGSNQLLDLLIRSRLTSGEKRIFLRALGRSQMKSCIRHTECRTVELHPGASAVSAAELRAYYEGIGLELYDVLSLALPNRTARLLHRYLPDPSSAARPSVLYGLGMAYAMDQLFNFDASNVWRRKSLLKGFSFSDRQDILEGMNYFKRSRESEWRFP